MRWTFLTLIAPASEVGGAPTSLHVGVLVRGAPNPAASWFEYSTAIAVCTDCGVWRAVPRACMACMLHSLQSKLHVVQMRHGRAQNACKLWLRGAAED